MKPIQGRLRSFGVRTTQGEWTFDVSAITGAGAAAAPAQHVAGADAQPQPSAPPQCPGGRDANLAKNNSKPSPRIGQQSHTDTSRARNVPLNDDNEDDDVFMEPPPRQPVAKKQCINATAKPPKNPVKYAHAPTVRCAPSTFNSFVDHLTLQQRRRIKAMGFGGLLCVSTSALVYCTTTLVPSSLSWFCAQQSLPCPRSDSKIPLLHRSFQIVDPHQEHLWPGSRGPEIIYHNSQSTPTRRETETKEKYMT